MNSSGNIVFRGVSANVQEFGFRYQLPWCLIWLQIAQLFFHLSLFHLFDGDVPRTMHTISVCDNKSTLVTICCQVMRSHFLSC